MTPELTQHPKPETTRSKTRRAQPKLSPAAVHQFVDELVGDDLHAKRVLSLSNGVVGVIHAAALAIHLIGEGLAAVTGANPKHAIKLRIGC
jgi:hypothetical protein